MATAAPAAKACLEQASAIWPNRKTASDGILSSSQHQLQNPNSDHDFGNAVDLTHDPANGCDAHAWVRQLAKRGDARVKYCISNGMIWSAARASEGWRVYSGDNKHTLHAHVSIYDGYRNDTSDWFKGAIDMALDAEAKRQIQAMLDQSEAQIMAAVRVEFGKAVELITGGARKRDEKGNVIDPNPNVISNADIYTQAEVKH